MKRAEVGIIGGTGLGDTLLTETKGERVDVETPYGRPSCPPILANWEGVDVAFIARHGPGHSFNPSNVPYRANILALKSLGVSAVIASGATGSLREEIEPGHLVICDQVIDKTFRRPSTFFDEELAVHVELADPFSKVLREHLLDAAKSCRTRVHLKGTYVCMEGPQFSTRAESHMHRAWGGDVIGMTAMPEARLAREAELPYALIALPTDYDCWRPHSATIGEKDLLSEILANLKKASDNALTLIRAALREWTDAVGRCPSRDALKLAIWSDLKSLSEKNRVRYEPLLAKYFSP